VPIEKITFTSDGNVSMPVVDENGTRTGGMRVTGVDYLTDEWRAAILKHTRVCGPSFEAFLYRFWLENTLWEAVNEGAGAPLTEAQERYLAHYKK